MQTVSDVTSGFHCLLMKGELRVRKDWAGLGRHAVRHLWVLFSFLGGLLKNLAV